VARKRDDRNLLELKPLRNLEWEEGENDAVVLLIPKFRHPWMRKWVVPRLKRPDFHVKTDRLGSFVWRKCDGKSTVLEISDAMGREFGADFDPAHDRICGFIRQLAKNDCVILND
jgi:hypothetical protein